MSDLNPREVIGSNSGDAPDYGLLESDRLRSDYSELFRTVDDLEAQGETALAAPEKPKVVSLIKLMRDTAKRVLAYHEMEKQPHYRRGQAVDQTFFGLHDRLAKRDRKANDGLADRLQQWLTDYDVKELAREQARRRQAALDARLEADRVLAEAENLERAAEAARKVAAEAAAAALRAKKPENVAARTEESRVAIAEANKLTDASISMKGDVAVAEAQAERAYIDTMATPADIMRERHDDGSLSGMGTEKFARITDRAILDLEKLRGYIAFADLEKALRGYANANAYSNDKSVQIAGAEFGKKPKSRVR